MPQPPDWKRALETGMNFTEMRRSRAHRIASDLVSQGQLARDQFGAAVDEIVDISRRRSEELRKVVAAEVHRQLRVLGLAGKHDLEGLEPEPKLRTGSAKTSTKRAPAEQGTAQKPAKKKAAAKKAAKKPAKKAAKKPAKKPAKKAATKKKASPAKKATKAAPAAKRAR